MTTAYDRKAITIRAVAPNGFPVDFQLETAGSLIAAAEELTAELLRRGYTPAQAAPAAAAAPDAPPACPTHGTPMKRSQNGSGWFCSKKDQAGAYCRQRA